MNASKICGMFLAVIVLYPLSIGPAVWWVETYQPGQGSYPVFNAFYAPLLWLTDNSTPVAKPIGWYVKLWIPKHYGKEP
jgi:hypothetical protein